MEMQREVDGQDGQGVLKLRSTGFKGALMVGVGLGKEGWKCASLGHLLRK